MNISCLHQTFKPKKSTWNSLLWKNMSSLASCLCNVSQFCCYHLVPWLILTSYHFFNDTHPCRLVVATAPCALFFIVTTGYCCTALMCNGFQMNDPPSRPVFTLSPLTGATAVNVAFDVLMHFPAAHLALDYLGFWQNDRVAGGPGPSTDTDRERGPHRRRLHFKINWSKQRHSCSLK